MARIIKWGILSAGQISHDFTAAVQLLPPDEHQVVAIGARNLQDAQKFAENFKIPKAYGSYSELALDHDVEVVYIGTIHPLHCETVKLMLNHGKHVLCEKPLAMNHKEVKEIIDLAKEKGLFLMEGIWSRFFPVYDHVRESLKNGPLKSATYLTANMGINYFGGAVTGAKLDRVLQNVNGGGALMTMGVYSIQLAMLLFKEEPERIVANGIIVQPNNIDKFTSITLYYSGDRVAQINLHFGAAMYNSALISCADLEQVIEIPFFMSPDKIITPEKTYKFPLPKSNTKHNFFTTPGFIYQIKAVRESLLKGETENPFFTHSESITMVKITDEVRRQIGLFYEADKQQNQHNL